MVCIREGELPTTGLHTTTGSIGVEGAQLDMDGVQVTFTPGSLPTGATVTAMSQTLEDGFKVNGTVSLSPVVSIGPHYDLELLKPVVVRLPLRDDTSQTPPTVLVSHTSCYDDFSWEKVRDEHVSYDCGFVEVCLSRCTTLYAQRSAKCAPSTVILKNDHLLFSVSSRENCHQEASLKVKFGSSEDSIMPVGAFTLAHFIADTREAALKRVIPRSTVEAIIQSKDKSIWQCDTPFDNDWDKGQPLKEVFEINTKPFSDSTSQLQGGNEEEFYIWERVKPGAPSFLKASGSLGVVCLEAEIVEQTARDTSAEQPQKKPPAPRKLLFSFPWSNYEATTDLKTG